MKRKKIHRARNLKCSFCEKRTEPGYRDFQTLATFVTERGKLLGRSRTGLCQKHQRKLSISVKRARYLARLAFVAVVS